MVSHSQAASGLRVVVLHDDKEAFHGPAGQEAFVCVWEAIEDVEGALTRLGHRHRRLSLGEGLAKVARDLEQDAPDVVFHLAETVRGDAVAEAQVAAFLELLAVAHTSESQEALIRARDKVRVKGLLHEAGVQTPAYGVSLDGGLPGPLPPPPWIAKPALEDGSVGIESRAVFARPEDLAERVTLLHRTFRTPILVESFAGGREFHAGVVGDVWLPLVEIDFSALPAGYDSVCSYASKWSCDSAEFEGVRYTCPARASTELADRLLRTAAAAARAIGVSRYCRFDLRLDEHDAVHVLDVNPNPDLSACATMAKMAEVDGMGFDAMVQRLLELGLSDLQGRGVRRQAASS